MIKLKSSLSLACLATCILGLASTPSLADGTHGSKANIINKDGDDREFILYVFNGNDQVRQIPHKTYTVNPGENQRIKCHGNGKGRCWVSNTLSDNTDDFIVQKNKTCNGKLDYFGVALEIKNCE